VPLRTVEAVLLVNENRKRAMARKVACALGGRIRGKTIGVLGLTFKPNTDDMREAPSIPLITALIDMGAKVKAYDPEGMEQARGELPAIKYCEDAYSAASGADGLVIVENENAYRQTLEAAGTDGNLFQTYVNANGHCGFSLAEFDGVFHALLSWVEEGTQPTRQAVADLCEYYRGIVGGTCNFNQDFKPDAFETRVLPREP